MKKSNKKIKDRCDMVAFVIATTFIMVLGILLLAAVIGAVKIAFRAVAIAIGSSDMEVLSIVFLVSFIIALVIVLVKLAKDGGFEDNKKE